LWAKNNNKNIRLLGRGTNITKTVDIAEILKREFKMEIPTLDDLETALDENNIEKAKKILKNLRKFEVRTATDKIEDRNVSSIEINLEV